MSIKRRKVILLVTIVMFAAVLTFAGEIVYIVNSYIHNSPIPDWATVAKLSGRDLTIIDTVTVSRCPHSVALTPDGRSLWVTSPLANNITVIDASSLDILRIIDFGETEHRPTGIAITPDGTRAYVTFGSLGLVSIFDVETYTHLPPSITVEGDPEFIVFSPDASKAYVVNTRNPQVAVIRTSDNTVVATIRREGELQDAVVSPDGSRVYVCNSILDRIEVIQTSDNTAVEPIFTGQVKPRSIGISPSGAYLFVGHRNPIASERGALVTMVRLSDTTIVSSVVIPHNARRLVVRPDGSRIFITEHDFDECYAFDVGRETLTPAAAVDLNTIPGFLASPVGLAIKGSAFPSPESTIPERFFPGSLYLIDCGPCPACFEGPCDPRVNPERDRFLIWDPYRDIAVSFSRSKLGIKKGDGPLRAAAPLKGWNGDIMFVLSVPHADSKIAETGAVLFFDKAFKKITRIEGKISGEQLGLDMDVLNDEVVVVSTKRLMRLQHGEITHLMLLDKDLLANRGIHVAFTEDMDGDKKPEILLGAPHAVLGKFKEGGKILLIGSKSKKVINTYYGRTKGLHFGDVLKFINLKKEPIR